MVEPDNLVLEQLRAMRSEMAKMADWMHTLSVEMTAVRQHLAGVVTITEHDHTKACPGEVESGSPTRTCGNSRIYGVSRSNGITSDPIGAGNAVDIAGIKVRLDRIEKRLELTD